MSWLGRIGTLSSFLTPEASAPEFRRDLEEMLHFRLKALGLLTLAVTGLHFGLKTGVLGASVQWSLTSSLQQSGEISFLETATSTLCGALNLWGAYMGVSLRGGRLIGTANATVPGTAVLYTDVLKGSITPGYMVLVFATVVALLPYRAWQTLSIGTVLTLLVLGAGSGLRPALGLAPAEMQTGIYALEIGLMTVLMTGISGVLHYNRYRLFAARREAEEARRDAEEAQQEAEEARRRAERQAERLAELDASKSRFFANISHELRTPLTTILGPLKDTLEGRYGDVPTELKKRLMAMKGQAERLQALVDQLLQLSKLEEGRMELEARPIDLGPFLRRMASLFESMADRQGADVLVQTGSSPSVCADPEALEQIVSNLLANALEHSPEGGTVRLSARETEVAPGGSDGEKRAEIAVRDSGPGLPEAVREELFERYAGARTGEEGTPSVSTGIGLAVVRELAERHGGSVQAESEEGVGTEIAVVLPATCESLPDEDVVGEGRTVGDGVPEGGAIEEASVPGPTVKRNLATSPTEEGAPARTETERWASRQMGEAPEGRPTVLVVDDEKEVRRYLGEVLRPRYAVQAAADGEEALEIARKKPPALVVSDVVMPRRDGYELCRALRADEQLRGVPIILLTVQGEQEHRIEGLREGADAYLTKPFDPEELRQRAENLIGIRRYLRSQRRGGETTDGPRAPEGEGAEASVGTESEFLREVRSAVEEHIGSSSFGVEWLADEVGLSTRQLQRRLQEETGLTAAAFIRALRLKRAAKLLEEGAVPTVKAAAEAVGYRNSSHFSQLFREAHGTRPSEFKTRS